MSSIYLGLYLLSVFEGELAESIPVVHTSIGGCRIIGTLCAGLSGGHTVDYTNFRLYLT